MKAGIPHYPDGSIHVSDLECGDMFLLAGKQTKSQRQVYRVVSLEFAVHDASKIFAVVRNVVERPGYKFDYNVVALEPDTRVFFYPG